MHWTIPGRVVLGYDARPSEASVVEVTKADLERPRISFFWLDPASGRTVQAKIRDKRGVDHEFVAVFDVEGPTMQTFSATTGSTVIVKEHGTTVMRFGTELTAPGVNWTWKITMPAHSAGFVKDVQTVLVDRSKVQFLKPGGKTRLLVRRHPVNTTPHVQLDADADSKVPEYSKDMGGTRIEAGQSFDTGRGIEDNPSTGLGSLDKTISVNDRFTYHVLFQPDVKDAIWVPVAKATWSWEATADHRGARWSLRKAPGMKPHIDKVAFDFPVYQSGASEDIWQEPDAASAHEAADIEDGGGDAGEFDFETPAAGEEFAPDKAPYAYDKPADPMALDPAGQGLFEYQVGGGTPSWAADIDPFPPAPTVAFQVNETHLLTAFAPVTTGGVKHLCAALVDLLETPCCRPMPG